jgi:uncharacterized protein YjbJ (UPF0337 family)
MARPSQDDSSVELKGRSFIMMQQRGGPQGLFAKPGPARMLLLTRSQHEKVAMNWNQEQVQWHRLAEYAVKSRWAKLTDDDLANVAGKKEQFAGKLQEHYGIVNQDAERQIDELLAKLKPGPVDKSS